MLSILSTKLHVPYAHPSDVRRPELIRQLNEGLWHTEGVDFTRRLTLVAAPAGYGKTTLLCEWARQLEIPVAWITFDEADDNLYSFLQYLIAALQRIDAGVGAVILSTLQSSQFTGADPPLLDALISLVNEVTVAAHPFILVLDDYHNIKSQEIHKAVMYLVDHLPEKLSVAIATRSDPPLSLARLRARRQLLEIRAKNLRFSKDEATLFLRQNMRLELQDPEIKILTERTEGWIAGLQMAGLALQERTDTVEFIQDFSGRVRFVIDYLFDEVLSRESEDIRTFLIQTSILDQMSGSLCDAVMGQPEAKETLRPTTLLSAPRSGQHILEYLERANLFLVPLDDERCYYRYHHLFSDLLRHRLHRDFPGLAGKLHRRAAEYLKTQGEITQAIEHLILGKDYAEAADLVHQTIQDHWNTGDHLTIARWLRTLPKVLVFSDYELAVDYGWMLAFTAPAEETLQFLGKSQLPGAAFPQSGIVEGMQACVTGYKASFIHSFLAGYRNDPHLAIAYAQKGLAPGQPEEYPLYRGIGSLFLGHAYYLAGEDNLAEKALSASIDLALESSHYGVYLTATDLLARLAILKGQLSHAHCLYGEAHRLIQERKKAVLAGIEQIGIGSIQYEFNQLDEAERNIRAGLETAEAGGYFQFIQEGYLARARLEFATGRLAEAFASLEKADEQLRHHPQSFERAVIQALRVRCWLAAGDWEALDEWVNTRAPFHQLVIPFQVELGDLVLARILIAKSRYADAVELLNHLEASTQAAGRIGRLIEVLILLSLAYHKSGQSESACQKMERALSIAAHGGYVRIFIDEGETAKSLIARCRAQIAQEMDAKSDAGAHLVAYADQLLAAFSGTQQKQQLEAHGKDIQSPDLIDQLTIRELEVLKLIAAGLSNKEIAQRLVVTIGTVKAHTSSIYQKLNVEGRTKALVRARELHLI